MIKKTFIWFVIKKPVKADLLMQRIMHASGNCGFAFYDTVIDKIDTGLLQFLKSSCNVPLAVYISGENHLKAVYPACFKTKIYSYRTRSRTFGKSDVARVNVRFNKKSSLQPAELLDQLSGYFSFKAEHPRIKTALEFTPYDIRGFEHFPEIAARLGFQNFIIPYSLKNLNDTKKLFSLAEFDEKSGDAKDKELFDRWRSQIDVLDKILIDTLNQRMQIVLEMGKYKKQNNLPYFQPERWHDIITSRKKTAKAANIDQELIEKIFVTIHLNNLKLMLG
ncbi:MAG TPA: chorismate mutase [Bacteroidales bacterium]|nr:chorismate mutase [Bacteroidales bacterium]